MYLNINTSYKKFMKRQKFRKIISIFMLIAMLVMPTVVYAASYSTTFDFLVSVQGTARTFSAGKINLAINSSEQKNGSRSGITTFSVTLYKKGIFTSTAIGSFKASRTGYTSDGWKNMEKGKYYFYLSKANDGARVSGSIHISQ